MSEQPSRRVDARADPSTDAPRPPALPSESERARSISDLDGSQVDVVVIGGGVTGVGVALDAASRGLDVVVLEANDVASGTSSASSKLIHGGLRYLEQYNLPLVREALGERGRLSRDLCPHLVRPLPFLFPLRSWRERAYVGAGVALYDGLAAASGDRLPRHRHLDRSRTRAAFPHLRTDEISGAIRYWDAQVDDARHTLAVARTAAAHGARIITRAPVVELSGTGQVNGVTFEDRATGGRHHLGAQVVINATGPWAEQTEKLGGFAGALRMRLAKGVHIVVDGPRIRGEAAVITRTATSVLFIIPFGRVWLLGTTDTAWNLPADRIVATSLDVDYLLAEAAKWLTCDLTRSDLIGVFSGVRPLIEGTSDSTAKLSREHLTTVARPGLVSIAGGKYTTYRIMAADAVDRASDFLTSRPGPSRTAELPLVGAVGLETAQLRREQWRRRTGLAQPALEQLLNRYGAETEHIIDLMAETPGSSALLPGTSYHEAEVRWAVRQEGALGIDDVLARRTRAQFDSRDRGWQAAERVATIMGEELAWATDRRFGEITNYRSGVEGTRVAERKTTDADALAVARRLDVGRA